MDFPIAIKLLHVFSIASAAAGAAVFMRIIGLKLFGINAPAMRWRDYSLDPVDVAMAITVAGVMGLCFSIGAIFAETVLSTSKLPHNNVLLIKSAVLLALVVSTILTQLYVKPKLNAEDPFAENDLPTLMLCGLALSTLATAIMFWAMIQAKPLAAADLVLANSLASFMLTASTLWLISIGVLTTAYLRRLQNADLIPQHVFPHAPQRQKKSYFKPEPTLQF